MSKHPRPSTFARFGKGLASRLQNQRIVRHLLAHCPDCESRLEQAARFDYSAAFEGVRGQVEQAGLDLAAERSAAPGRLRTLAALPEEGRLAAIEADPAFRTWGLCELLQDASQELAFHNSESLDLARLGVEVAMRLDGGRYGEARVNDLAGRAWAVLGCAELAGADDPAAERSLAQARKRLRAGTGDLLEQARLLLLESLLHARRHRLRHAVRLLARVMSIGRRLDDDALCGKARVLQEQLIQVLRAGAESLPALVLLAVLKPASRIREGV
jgi:hypothetical protein